MSTTIPDPQWKHLGSTSNAEVYEAADDVLAIVPHADTRDTEDTARESLAFQQQHWKGVGRRGAVIVYMDPVLDQDAGARAVYATETQELLTTCYALVGESFFAQAAAAVFTGLAQPGPPTRVFRSVAEAQPWIAEMNEAHGGPL